MPQDQSAMTILHLRIPESNYKWAITSQKRTSLLVWKKNDRVEILTMQLPVRDRIKISYNSKIFTGANYTA